jgi:hypothetical protein
MYRRHAPQIFEYALQYLPICYDLLDVVLGLAEEVEYVDDSSFNKLAKLVLTLFVEDSV